jgi:hypothetical protein
MAFSRTMVLGSESHGNHDLILLSDASRRLQSHALWHKLSQSVTIFASRCSVTAPNSGNSSVLVLTSLPAGCRLTTNPKPTIHRLWVIMTQLVASLYNLGTDRIENTTLNNLFYCSWIRRRRNMFTQLPLIGSCNHITVYMRGHAIAQAV